MIGLSFIKIHALLEAAVSQLLTQHIGDGRMRPVFEQLEMSNSRTGKLAFVKALALLTPREQGLVRKMSELRNELVPRVSNVNFSFQDHVAALDANQRDAWRKNMVFFTRDDAASSKWNDKAIEDPKFATWVGTVSLLTTIQLGISEAETERHRNTHELELLREYFAEIMA